MSERGPGPHICRAGPNDARTVAALWRAELPRPWTETAVQTLLEDPRAAVWLALAAPTPAGRKTNGVSALGFLAAQRIEDCLEILAVAVTARERRRGVAATLFHRALDAAQSSGCRRFELEVAAHNSAAIGLYRGAGFVAVGRRSRYYGGVEDAILMTKVASEAAHV